MWFGLWIGCSGAVDPPPSTDTTPAVTTCSDEETVVQFETPDGLVLEADDRQAATDGRPVVLLFHMIPPSNDRSGWPRRVRNALADLDVNVLNVDRRGAGGSEGEAVDAYTGPGGRLDVVGALEHLTDPSRGCTINPSQVVLFGASNGTTSTLDYAADPEPGLPEVAGLAWLSPGTYTEAQTSVDASQSTLGAMPMAWLFPVNEPYSLDFEATAPADWTFVKRGMQHGTGMFDGGELEDDTVADLVAFVQRAVL